MFTEKDISLLKEKSITIEAVTEQIDRFKTGFEMLDVIKPATPNDGIKILNDKQKEDFSKLYDDSVKDGLTIMKFVPASGAATRMFKDLYQFLDNPVSIKELPANHPIVKFVEQLPKFAFFPILQQVMKNVNLEDIETRKSKPAEIITETLNNKSLNYGHLPKGLIHFHSYPDKAIRTAIEEHLVEGSYYAVNKDNTVKIHFTVSPEHFELFQSKLKNEGSKIENKYGIKLDVSFSFQKPYTDTIAVAPDNKPIRDMEGNFIFRPGGHGALIENLNEQDADLIFIKNIDNVVAERLIGDTANYKKALGGLALSLQKEIFGYLKDLDCEINENLIEKICIFIENDLFVSMPEPFKLLSISQKAEYLRKYLNRPIRVCGMVRNEGEPGGGPFWIKEKTGLESLQILESAQLDLSNPHQAEQQAKTTHFNPVDLVCSAKDYKGVKFNLTNFTDPETGFISEKSINGLPVKALELPGLWNGAMANWITLFAEVPVSTFNPVKTVNDLLRAQHQAF